MYLGIPCNTSFVNFELNLCIETNVQMLSEEDSAVPLETTEKDANVEVEPYDTEAAEKGPYRSQCLVSVSLHDLNLIPNSSNQRMSIMNISLAVLSLCSDA